MNILKKVFTMLFPFSRRNFKAHETPECNTEEAAKVRQEMRTRTERVAQQVNEMEMEWRAQLAASVYAARQKRDANR